MIFPRHQHRRAYAGFKLYPIIWCRNRPIMRILLPKSFVVPPCSVASFKAGFAETFAREDGGEELLTGFLTHWWFSQRLGPFSRSIGVTLKKGTPERTGQTMIWVVKSHSTGRCRQLHECGDVHPIFNATESFPHWHVVATINYHCGRKFNTAKRIEYTKVVVQPCGIFVGVN